MNEVQNKIQELRGELKSLFKERDEEIDGLLVAMLSRHHILLIGPRGTAKSLMIRTLASAITGAKYWERLLTRFSTPEEIFGTIKLSALKHDKFERHIEGHLPTANFGFCDEVFKGNSSILNCLLTLINERLFHNDGDALKCPLETLMGASNELPSDESLNALYDRFLMRYKLQYIEEDSAFRDMLTMPEPTAGVQLSFDELHDAQKTVSDMSVPDSVLDAIIEIRKQLKKEGIIPSDRRYRDAQKVIRAYAYLQGKSQVSTDDLTILTHVLWDEPTHISIVERVVVQVSNPLQRTADELMDAIHSAWKEVEDIKEEDKKVMQGAEAVAKIKKAQEQLENLKNQMKAEGRDVSKVESYIRKADDIKKKKILRGIMGIKE